MKNTPSDLGHTVTREAQSYRHTFRAMDSYEVMRRKEWIMKAMIAVQLGNAPEELPQFRQRFCKLLGYPNSHDPFTLAASLDDEALDRLKQLQGPNAYTLFRVWEARNE